MKAILLFIILLATAQISFGQIKELETTAEIKSVMIYNSSAEINYEKDVLLPQGKSTIIFTDLTPFIVENTINIRATNPEVDIITITEKINYTKEKKEDNAKIKNLQDSITHLNNEIGLLKCKTDALNMEKDLLFKGESIGGVAKGVAVSEIEKASVFFRKRYLELSTELFKLSEAEKSLQSSLTKYNNQMQELSANTSKSGSEIQVTVNSPSQKKVLFVFKFLTSKAGWAPVYDCKYKGAGVPLEFIFRANVFNASGVAWENIDVKLSTADPMNGFDTPSFSSKKDKRTEAKTTSEDKVQFREIEVANSIAEYEIKHKYTIPSDSKPYLIDVNSYSIRADFNYLLIPKLDPFGFLMAKIPNWNDYNLIPGTTNIYNKGSYMGKTFLNTYAENDTLSLYLGKDNTIQAVRKETESNYRKNIIGNYYIDKSAISITVKNNSEGMFAIQLLDQVPIFSINEKVKFNIENIEQADYDKNEGLLTWSFQLSNNESKTIDYKYEVKIPKDEIGAYHPSKKRFRTIKAPSW